MGDWPTLVCVLQRGYRDSTSLLSVQQASVVYHSYENKKHVPLMIYHSGKAGLPSKKATIS